MKKKLIVTTILGTGLLFNANAYAAYDMTGINNINELYQRVNATKLYDTGTYDEIVFYSLKNPEYAIKAEDSLYFVNGEAHNSRESALTASNSLSFMDFSDQQATLTSQARVSNDDNMELIIRNPNGTSVKINSESGFVNGTKYTTEESFLNALFTPSGMYINENSKISANGETLTLDQLFNDPKYAPALEAFAEMLDLDEGISLEEFKEGLKDFNNFQAQNDAGINQLTKAKQFTDDRNTLSLLEAKETRTAEEEQKVAQLRASLAANEGANLTPSSSDTQEILKTQAESLEQLKGSNNPIKQATYEAKLKQLESLQEAYFVDASKTKTLEELTPAQKPDTLTTDTLSASTDTITGVVNNRLHGFTAEGVASGDFLQSLGGWVKGLYTKADQKTHGLTPGYKLDQSGATIGFDAGDDVKIGVAYSFAKSRVTAKTINAKENITSHIGTIYGLTTMDNQFFAAGQGSYGISHIKKSRSTGDINNNVASAKTKGNVMSGKLEVGYDYIIQDSPFHFVPSVGVAHNTINVKGYKESGAGLNRKINKRTTSRTSALLGVMAKYEANVGAVALMPEVHANLDYAVNSKNADTKITVIDGLTPLVTPSAKLTKMKYNVGTSVKLIQSKVFNAGVGYDFGLAKKFRSHTGSVNVRAEF